MRDLGDFVNETGILLIADPGHDERSGILLEQTRKGTWRGYSLGNKDGVLIAALYARHSDCEALTAAGSEWEPLAASLGVDSGMAGIFDVDYFRFGDIIPEEPRSKYPGLSRWYRACMDQAASESRAGVIPYGVVSEAGYGDGLYPVWVCKDSDGCICAVKIDFIPIP